MATATAEKAEFGGKWSEQFPGYLAGRKPGDGHERVAARLAADPSAPFRTGRFGKPASLDALKAKQQAEDAFPADTEGVWRVSLPALPELELPGTFGDRRRDVERRYEDLMSVKSVNRNETDFDMEFVPKPAGAKPAGRPNRDKAGD